MATQTQPPRCSARNPSGSPSELRNLVPETPLAACDLRCTGHFPGFCLCAPTCGDYTTHEARGRPLRSPNRMDLRTGFDDEHFFERYADEQAAAAELDTAEAQPPTAEQLAHLTRFRKPVAWLVVGLALFSLLALEEHGARRAFLSRYGAPRELVAHYGAAIARPTTTIPTTATTIAATTATTAAAVELPSPTDSSDCEPLPAATPNSEPVAEFVSMLTAMCLPEASTDLELARPNDVGVPSASRLLDLCLAGGQAQDSWPLPLSMTWSS